VRCRYENNHKCNIILNSTFKIAALSQGPQDVVALSKEIVEETTRTHLSLQTKGIGTREFTALVRQLDSEDQSYKL